MPCGLRNGCYIWCLLPPLHALCVIWCAVFLSDFAVLGIVSLVLCLGKNIGNDPFLCYMECQLIDSIEFL